jgi:hypothetical protein
MSPKFYEGNVRANCPDCGGAVTSFEYTVGGQELGTVVRGMGHGRKLVYHLLKCAGCSRGGLAVVRIESNISYPNGQLIEFYPRTIDSLNTPPEVPPGIQSEFKEAELCASVGGHGVPVRLCYGQH